MHESGTVQGIESGAVQGIESGNRVWGSTGNLTVQFSGLRVWSRGLGQGQR